ncbi:MAG TPA: prolipoprotein diacylglyceryl transferase [Nitriliruptoraceae bacterium]|nr:prolipoprotein diacylglyceryl transferase [Nitriliruptoraceae bacterium]
MPTSVLAAIPYRTLPDFPLGPITIRTFGLMVALGIVIGAVIGSRYVANRGMDPEQYTALATRAVIIGLIGARLTWVLSHLDSIESPLDVIAVWEGGMQFSGGLLFGALAGWWFARGRFSRTQRWHIMDGTAVGLTVGLAVGRLGCMAVGEHFGGPTDFFLGMTYLGGGTVEAVAVNETIHNTAFYEFLQLAVLGVIYAILLRIASDRQRPWPLGMLGTIFLIWYGTFRFITDTVRVNDERLAGLTGAQWACIGVVALGLWLLVTMGGRRASQEGREVVPVTSEPRSAVKVVTTDGSDGAAVEDAEGDEDTRTDAETTGDEGSPDEDTRGDDRTGDVPAAPAPSGGTVKVVAAPDEARTGGDDTASVRGEDDAAARAGSGASTGATATRREKPSPSDDQPNWADRADVRDGTAGFVAGVRVLPDATDEDDEDGADAGSGTEAEPEADIDGSDDDGDSDGVGNPGTDGRESR